MRWPIYVAAVFIHALTAQTTSFYQFNLTSFATDLLNYGPARTARIRGADSLVFDRSGNLYLSENGMIRRITPDGMIAPLLTPVPNQLGPNRYRAMTMDPAGNLFVIHYLDNDRFEVLRRTPDGATTIWVDAAALPRSVLTSMAAGNQGELYVLGLSRVIRVGPDRSITPFAGTGTQGFSGDGGPAASAMIFAYGITAGSDGTVYLADTGNDRIRAIDRDGTIRTVAGLSSPNSVLSNAKGTLYVSSSFPPAIYEVDEGAHTVTLISGTLAGGKVFLLPRSGDGGPASEARLGSPGGMALDSAASLYFVEDGARVRRISPEGILTTVAGCGCSQEPVPVTWLTASSAYGVIRDSAGNVYFSDRATHQIRRVGPDGIARVIAGRGEPGFSGDGGPAVDARLSWPAGLAIDSDGNLYIADTENNRIRRVTPAGTISTAAGNGDGAVLGSPEGVAVDAAGNVYVSDTGGHRVRRALPDGGLVTVAGSGQPGTGGDGGPGTAAQLSNPRGLSIDTDGGVVISDSSAHQVRKLMADGTIRTLLNIGPFGTPYHAIPDNRGGLLVADPGLYRLLRVDANGNAQSILNTSAQSLTLTADGTIYLAQGTLSALRTVNSPPVPLAPAISSMGIANVAGRIAGVVAPGEILSIFGAWLGPEAGVTAPASSGSIATVLGGVRVLIDQIPAPILYAATGQINAVVPFEIAGRDHVTVRTEFNGVLSNAPAVPVLPVAPALFQEFGLAALNHDGAVNSAVRPAHPGELISLFGTGAGAMEPAQATGQISGSTLSRVTSPVSAVIGGAAAEVVYAGSAPGFVAGALQINVRIPAEAAPFLEGAGFTNVLIQIGDQMVPGRIYFSR